MSMLVRYSFKPIFADRALALSSSATACLRLMPVIPSLGKGFHLLSVLFGLGFMFFAVFS